MSVIYSGDEEYNDGITSGELFSDVPKDDDRENMIIDLSEYFDREYLALLSWRALDTLWREYFD